MKKTNITKNLFALSLLTVCVNSAIAQEANNPDDELEIIQVRGYMGSVKQGILNKRASDTIVDSIESEDLGKFPDANVAESLQRVTGVSISRNGGEGSKVSIRGLGPEYSVTTLNGRVLPNPDGSRSFSYDVLASEMITGAEVFKAFKAELNDGGIGGLVNVKTIKPLKQQAGITNAFSVSGMYDDLTEESTPKGSALVNYTNDDATFGIAGSIAYTKRKARTDEAGLSGWSEREFDLDANGAKELRAWAPMGIGFRAYNTERERLSGLIAAQWAPTDNLTLTFDTLYSDYETKSTNDQIAHWWGKHNTNNGGPGSVKIDEQGTVVYWAGHAAPTEFVHSTGHRPTKTYMVGFNAEWFISDDSTLTFDVSQSNAKNQAAGLQSFAVSGFRNTTESSSLFQIIPGDTLPSLTFPEFGNSATDKYVANPSVLTDTSVLANHFMVVEGDNNEDTIKDAKLDWSSYLEFGPVSKVKAGVFYNKREFQRRRFRSADDVNNGTSTGFGDPIPSHIGKVISPVNFLNGALGSYPIAWISTDNEALRAYYESDDFIKHGKPYIEQDEDGDGVPNKNLDYTPSLELHNSPGVTEENQGFYIQVDLEGEVASMPWTGNLGVRTVKTEQTSKGYGRQLLSIKENPNDSTIMDTTYSENTPIEVTNEYTEVLPSLNLKLEVTEDVELRVALSETITRPELGRLGVDVGYNTRPGSFTLSGGNPNLKPYKSTNYDITANWYASESAFFGLTYMEKEIKDFIVTAVGQDTILGFDFTTTRPENVESVNISAWELGGFVSLDFLPGVFSGISLQANYTMPDSDSSYRESTVEGGADKFGIEGLSDTANFIVSYEYGDVQMRLSYNWRDKYLNTVSDGSQEPRYTSAYGQVDGSFNYDLNDDYSVYVQGINLTEEATRSYVRYENRLDSYHYDGRRFIVGLRGRF